MIIELPKQVLPLGQFPNCTKKQNSTQHQTAISSCSNASLAAWFRGACLKVLYPQKKSIIILPIHEKMAY